MTQAQPLDDRMRRIRPLVLRFSPGRGVLADAFPQEIVIAPDVLLKARAHSGVFRVQGAGRIGTTLTVTVANGEAVYELTSRCVLADGKQTPAWVAARRAWKLKVAGEPVEVRVYGLDSLKRLFGLWPLAAAIRQDVMQEIPVPWRQHIAWRKDLVTFAADGETAEYRVFGRHPGFEEPPVYLIERLKLVTRDRTALTLPPAHLAGTSAF